MPRDVTISVEDLTRTLPKEAVPWAYALAVLLSQKDKQPSRQDLAELIQNENLEVTLRISPRGKNND